MVRRSVALIALAVMLSATASAQTVKFQTTLTAGAEVPPTKSSGSGEATVFLDTVKHEITWDVTFKGFVSPVVAAHIHGPADPGQNAGVLIPLGNNPVSPLHGIATLTDEEQNELLAGADYVNIHSRNNPSGAIRGQLTVAN